MSILTDFLKLFKYDDTDRTNNVNFNIDTALNENWDKIEANALLFSQQMEQKADGLQSDVTYYVATTGSDTTGDGTESKPYATTWKALAVIPKNLNGYTATIYISAGTYDGNISIYNFSSGKIKLIKNGDVIINGTIYVLNCCIVELNVSTINASVHGLVCGNSCVKLTDDITITTTNTSGRAISVENGGIVALISGKTCTINDCYVSIWSMYGATVCMYGTVTGSGNKRGYVTGGGTIMVNTTTLEATTLISKSAGGQVLTGAGIDLE